MRELAGVCGVVSTGDRLVELHLVDTMIAPVPHRVTGGLGRFESPHGTLAQLYRGWGAPTEASRASGPWVDPETGTVVAADARIDNSDELRRALGDPAPPPDAGPLPLIGAAYRRWGLDCLSRLIGDFAIVIWDPSRHRLALARDPMSMRALYYRVEPERVLLATEVKQILAVPGVPAEPDERMVACFLAGCFGDLEWTYFQGISQVRPAHVVVFQAGSSRSVRFWEIEPGADTQADGPGPYHERFRDAFLEAVRSRAGSAERTGVFLSGGIDSGAISSAIGHLRRSGTVPGDSIAYSWDFGRFTEADERHLSRIVTRAYGMESRELPVQDLGPLAGYPTESAPDVDDPLHTPFHAVLDQAWTQARADGVQAVFSGFRGDLMVGPLDLDYHALARASRWRELTTELQIEAQLRGESLPASMLRQAGRYLRSEVQHLGRILRSGSAPGLNRPSDLSEQIREKASLPWIDEGLARRVDLQGLLEDHLIPDPPPLRGPLRRRRYQLIFTPVNLRWAAAYERRTARFNQQAVDPWSDVRIATLCAGMPQQVMDPDGTGDKPFPREALRGILPDEFRKNARKIRPTPLYRSSLLGPAVDPVRDLLLNSIAASNGWVRPLAIRRAFESFVKGTPLQGEFWWAISLEWWLRMLRGSR